jgi:tRNA-specific 2-thiouridylase
LTQEQLGASSFPLGDKTKAEVRELARESGLIVAEKPESMEICFVDSGVREFVEEQVAAHPERFESAALGAPSTVVTSDGRTLGDAQPYYRYTVGQRRGLGIAASERLYVLGIEPEANRVTVGPEGELFARGLEAERTHWIGPAPESEVEAEVRIRSRHAGVRSRIRPRQDGTVTVEFECEQFGVTPGQAAVFYDGSRVLGGSWITAALTEGAS